MAEDEDRDLPLHDEAKARSKWRDGETIVGKGGSSGPASEVDDAGGGGPGGVPDSSVPEGLAKRPPD